MSESQGQKIYLEQIEENKVFFKFFKSETDDGLASCSNFDERPTPEELEMDTPVLSEINHLRGKITNEQLKAIKDVLDRIFRIRTLFRDIKQISGAVILLNAK